MHFTKNMYMSVKVYKNHGTKTKNLFFFHLTKKKQNHQFQNARKTCYITPFIDRLMRLRE